MPKIVINEYDKTRAVANEYANFAVAVPGPVGNESDLTVFDDNGIFECSSQAEFIKKIGLQANNVTEGVATKEAIAAIPKDLSAAEEAPVEGVPAGYYKIAKDTAVYTKSEKAGAKKAGHLVDEDGYTYEFAFISDGMGIFKNQDETYYTFEEGAEGSEEVKASSVTFMGNQIAYELLSLGYTVFYKKYSSLDDLKSADFWEALCDKANYDFRYIMSGYLDTVTEVNDQIIAVAKNRADCIALLDIDHQLYTGNESKAEKLKKIYGYVNSIDAADKNCALFMPAVTYNIQRTQAYKTTYGSNYKFPASFHYLTCLANASEKYAEWYAASGYTRGVSAFDIASVDFTIGESIINSVQPRCIASNNETVKHAINVVAKFRDQYLLWGNRTANLLRNENSEYGDLIASDFLNIRQLCCTLKKQIYVACRQLTFDPNSDTLWINFKNKIRPILEKMKADQGIEDYEFVKIVSNVPKATLKAQIRIVPIEAVEDFNIDVTLEDSIEGVVVEDSDAE